MHSTRSLARLVRLFAVTLAVAAVSVFASATPSAPPPVDPPDRNPPFSAIYVLGDSLSDTGRASAVLTAALGTAFPPPPYAAGRLCNGALWIELLAPQLRLTYAPLDNYAWAGANTGRTNVFTGLPGMLDELDELVATGRNLDKKALYVVFGGANDFFRIFGGEDPATVIADGVTNLLRIVQQLRAAGAEHIVVVDLPDIGLTPRAALAGASSVATALSAYFNSALNAGLDQLPPVVRVSSFALLNAMVANPTAYGLTNLTVPALLAPSLADSSLFWDDVHPTTHTQGYVASAIFDALADAGLLKQLLKHP